MIDDRGKDALSRAFLLEDRVAPGDYWKLPLLRRVLIRIYPTNNLRYVFYPIKGLLAPGIAIKLNHYLVSLVKFHVV